MSIDFIKPIAFDYETTKEGNPDLLSFAYYNSGGEIESLVFDFNDNPDHTLINNIYNEATTLVAHNLKFDAEIATKHGISQDIFEKKAHDTMLMCYVLDTERLKGLKENASLVGMSLTPWEVASKLPRDLYKKYCSEDAITTLKLYDLWWPQLKPEGVYGAYRLELDLIWCVLQMERDGIKLDIPTLNAMSEKMKGRMEDLKRELYELGGKVFDLLSTQQLGSLLYYSWKLPILSKTPKGKPSVTADTITQFLRKKDELKLSERQVQFFEKFQEYKELSKLITTYFSKKFFSSVGANGRVHAKINQCSTRTGRFSIQDPPLQTIPSSGDIADAIRRCFIPEDSNIFIVSDYSQIEYRLLAHFTGDSTLISAYLNNEDLHKKTGELMGVGRKEGKNLNFSTVYGMGPTALAHTLNVSIDRAKELFELYFKNIPKVKPFKNAVTKYAYMTKYMRTISGRRRGVHNYLDKDNGVIDRLALNTLIQGSSGDLLKVVMLRAFKEFRNTSTRMVLTVHDELIFECPEDQAEEVSKRVKDIMENTFTFDVPIVAEPGIGKSWAEAKK